MREATRTYISLWNQVWFHYRQNNNLLPQDAVLIKSLKPGKTLFYNSFGCRFQDHVANAVIYEQMFDQTPDLNQQSFDNVVVLNNAELRYLPSNELANCYANISTNLLPSGKLIVSFNSIWLLWNRLAHTLNDEIDCLIQHMEQRHFQCLFRSIKPFSTTSHNGDCILIFTKL